MTDHKTDNAELAAVGNDTTVVPADAAPHDANAKRMRIFAPADNPEEANCYIGEVGGDLSALIERIEEYLPEMTEGREFVIRVKAMTDAEVEALPDL